MICKWCGETVKAGSRTCRRCKRDIPALSDCGGFYDLVAAEVPASAPIPQPSPVMEVPVHPVLPEPKKNSPLLGLICGVAAVLAVVFLIMTISLSGQLADAREEADRLRNQNNSKGDTVETDHYRCEHRHRLINERGNRMEQNTYQGSYGAHNGQYMDYTVDMVFCIDATGSMEDFTGSQKKIINMVKQNALNFYNDFSGVMSAKGKKARQLRVRVIAFRDYRADGEHAMMVTDFFCLPQQEKEFEACINSIHADGGGDIPEDGLEALAYAIKSKWTNEGAKKRQVIVVWTDAGTHELGFGCTSPYYPKGMPRNMSELNDWWDDMNANYKRLVLFAPDEPGWSYIAQTWENVVHIPSAAGNGLAEQNYGEILNHIANSV